MRINIFNIIEGDVLKDSEVYRWMGPSRYDFSGFKTILNLGWLLLCREIITVTNAITLQHLTGSYEGEIMFKEGITSGTPKDRNICRRGYVCNVST